MTETARAVVAVAVTTRAVAVAVAARAVVAVTAKRSRGKVTIDTKRTIDGSRDTMTCVESMYITYEIVVIVVSMKRREEGKMKCSASKVE